MNMICIKEKLSEFFFEEFSISRDLLQDDTSLIDGGWLDSYGIVNLAMFIENSFGVEILLEELTPEKLDSLESITGFIQQKISES